MSAYAEQIVEWSIKFETHGSVPHPKQTINNYWSALASPRIKGYVLELGGCVNAVS